MADEKNVAQSKIVFDTLCTALDERSWKYEKDEEKLIIDSGVSGDDLPIPFKIIVNAEGMVVSLFSALPFTVSEDKRIDVALAITVINELLADGCFRYDVTTGLIIFNITNSYIDSIISEELLYHMILLACQIVDEYNDKFLMISKGLLSLESFLESMAQ